MRATDGPVASGSYSSALRGPASSIAELVNLVRVYTGDVRTPVARAVAHLSRVEQLVEEHTGVSLEGQRMLDVGAGQRLIQMRYFSMRNDVVGIDRDLIVQGFRPRDYAQMLRTNGAKRTLKTLGRKALLVDTRYRRELERVLGRRSPRRFDVRRMDAENLAFPAASFDVVYSTTVVQYLLHPERALAEMVRVVRPGGVVYVDFMPFTGPSGAMDIRLLGGRAAEIPPWAHLRQQHAALVVENAPVSHRRLSDWRALFEDLMPDCAFVLDQPGGAAQRQLAQELRAGGELLEYDVDELVTSGVSVIWRKPTA